MTTFSKLKATLLAGLIVVFACDVTHADLVGMDWGHSYTVSRSYRAYRVSLGLAQHFANRRITFRAQIATEIVWIDGEAVWPLTFPLNLGLLTLAQLPNRDLGIKLWHIILAPNSSTELNLDRFNRWKLFGEMQTDYLLFGKFSNGEYKRGIILTPQVGFQFPAGPLKFRLAGGHSYYWRFDVRNRSLGWTAKVRMCTGFEFM
jgi:hypothetical protein